MFIPDLEETFNCLCSFRWKLNPTKCVFSVPSRKLLGFIVSHRGIEANPEKINVIMDMEAPSTIKDVQKPTGCMAALNRFLSKLGERGLPFFKLLKKQDNFQWSQEAADALEDLKQHLQSPPILTAPNARRRVTSVHRSYYPRRQHDNCDRASRRRARLRRPTPCLLCQ